MNLWDDVHVMLAVVEQPHWLYLCEFFSMNERETHFLSLESFDFFFFSAEYCTMYLHMLVKCNTI